MKYESTSVKVALGIGAAATIGVVVALAVYYIGAPIAATEAIILFFLDAATVVILGTITTYCLAAAVHVLANCIPYKVVKEQQAA